MGVGGARRRRHERVGGTGAAGLEKKVRAGTAAAAVRCWHQGLVQSRGAVEAMWAVVQVQWWPHMVWWWLQGEEEEAGGAPARCHGRVPAQLPCWHQPCQRQCAPPLPLRHSRPARLHCVTACCGLHLARGWAAVL